MQPPKKSQLAVSRPRSEISGPNPNPDPDPDPNPWFRRQARRVPGLGVGRPRRPSFGPRGAHTPRPVVPRCNSNPNPDPNQARTLRAGRQRPRALSLCMARARREAPWAARLLRFGPRPA
eukprot:scaffold27142_cov50-Phaeocystis_antarctica.AAC.2